MAAARLVFKVTGNTSSGDYVRFTYRAVEYTFEAVGFFKSPSVGQWKASNDTVLAAARIRASINDRLNPEINVTEQGSVIYIDVVDSESTENFTLPSTNGNIEVVDNIDSGDGGTGTGGDEDIAITLVQHECKEYYPSQPKTFIYGSLGDIVTTTIEFTTAEPITHATFKGITREKEEQIYTGSDSYEIDKELFRSPVSNDLMQFNGTFGTLDINNPKTGVDGGVDFQDLGSNDYRIIHTHKMQRVVRPEDINISTNTLITPSEYDGPNSLKYIFEIELTDDLINPNPKYTTKNVDLTEYFTGGNVGYVDEFLNGMSAHYTLVDSFSFDTGDGEIDRNQNSKAEFQIQNNYASTPNFTTSTQLIIFVQEVKSEYETFQTLNENLNIERLSLFADSVVVSGTNIINAEAAVDTDTTLINVSFEIASNTIDGDYALILAVSNDNSTINHNNVFLQTGSAGITADETTINFNTYPDADRTDYNFNYHYNNDIANSYNEIVSCVEDFICARFRVENSAVLPVTNTLVQFEIQIKNRITGQVFENYIIPVANLPVDETRGFQLEDDDIKNQIKVIETEEGVWDFIYGFQIWETWIGQENLVFDTLCTFDQLTNTGEVVQFTKQFQSPDFTMWNYDTSINTDLEPKVLRSPESIQFFDNETDVEVKGIVKGRDTRIYATFQDDNLDDLQVSSADELTGYLGTNSINSNQFQYQMFHSLVENGADRPYEQISGEPNFNAFITLLSVKKCSIEAVLVWNKFIELFPSDESFRVTARIDKIIAGLSCFIFQTNINAPVDGPFDPSIQSFTGVDDFQWEFENGEVLFGSSISTNDSGLDGTIQNVSLCSEDLTKIESIDMDDIGLYGDFDVTQLINTYSFGLQNNSDLTSYIIGSGVDVQYIHLGNCNISEFNLSARTFNGSSLLLSGNSNLTTVNFGDNTHNATGLLYISDCNTTTLDFTKWLTIGSLQGNNNTNLSTILINHSFTITQAISFTSTSITSFDWSNANIVSSNFFFALNNNSNLTTINNPTTSGVFSSYRANNCNLLSIDFSGLTGLSGTVSLHNNLLLSSVILPIGTETISNLSIYNCSLTTINILDMPNMTNINNGGYNLQNNSMTAAQVNKILVDLDAISIGVYTGRTINIAGTNAAVDSTSGGNDGLAAITSLQGKGFTITYNI
jgi:hypothetical protein